MTNRPFNRSYVLSITLKHIRHDIEFSIEKTLSRIPEFEGDGLRSMEIMQTLSALHSMKRDVEQMATSLSSGIQG